MHVSSSENIQQLEEKIGYTFKRKALLEEAITHKSFAKEKSGELSVFNERLEFLGDAVLELIICDYLVKSYPEFTEAELSKVKSYAVQESTLASVAAGLDLGSYLYLGKGEMASGGKDKPSILANAFEAVLAAVYLDSGLKNVREIALKNLEDRIKTLISGNLIFDFKTRFQEVVQEKFGILPKYRVHKEEGPEHRKIFEIEAYIKNDLFGRGKGKSKKEAAQKAAEAALKKIAEEE
ncbi:MAG: ribonuclease III [Nitrospirae bacterium]|nr:ribonuclease III [Nitrospirota bacterium]